MRKFILTLLCISVFFLAPLSAPPQTVQANGESYACILSKNVFFYEREEESSGLFLLPYTYYVKILQKGAPYCYVQYLTDKSPFRAVYGYCKTNELKFVDYVPERPFLYYTVDATYSLTDNAPGGDLSSLTVTYAYYGDYVIGSSVYHYVRLDEKTGYLPKTKELDYELNDDCFAPASAEKTSSAEQVTPMTAGQIALTVTVICLLAGGGYFAFRPKKDIPITR